MKCNIVEDQCSETYPAPDKHNVVVIVSFDIVDGNYFLCIIARALLPNSRD